MCPPHHDHAEDQKSKGGNAEQFPHGTKPSMTANWGTANGSHKGLGFITAVQQRNKRELTISRRRTNGRRLKANGLTE